MQQKKMAGYDEIRRHKDDLIKIIKTYVPEGKIYLFASHALDTEKFGSDIDLAIDAGVVIDKDILTKICAAVDRLHKPFFIDVIDVNAVYDNMRDHIKETGMLWSA